LPDNSGPVISKNLKGKQKATIDNIRRYQEADIMNQAWSQNLNAESDQDDIQTNQDKEVSFIQTLSFIKY